MNNNHRKIDVPYTLEIYEDDAGSKYRVMALVSHYCSKEEYVIFQSMSSPDTQLLCSLVQFNQFFHSPDTVLRDKKSRGTENVSFLQQAAGQERPKTPVTEQSSQNNAAHADSANSFAYISRHADGASDSPAQSQAATKPRLFPELDPSIEEFLENPDIDNRLNILAAIKHRIDDKMIDLLAVTIDTEVPEGYIEDRYIVLRNALLMKRKYEHKRLE